MKLTRKELNEKYNSLENLTEEERYKFEQYAEGSWIPMPTANIEYIITHGIYGRIYENLSDPMYSTKDIKGLYKAIDQLTMRQRQIIMLHLKGKNKVEIAKELGLNQSTITHMVNGVPVYKDGKIIKRYEGILGKLKRIILGGVKCAVDSCSNKIVSTSSRVKYCSDDCRKENKRIRRLNGRNNKK